MVVTCPFGPVFCRHWRCSRGDARRFAKYGIIANTRSSVVFKPLPSSLGNRIISDDSQSKIKPNLETI